MEVCTTETGIKLHAFGCTFGVFWLQVGTECLDAGCKAWSMRTCIDFTGCPIPFRDIAAVQANENRVYTKFEQITMKYQKSCVSFTSTTKFVWAGYGKIYIMFISWESMNDTITRTICCPYLSHALRLKFYITSDSVASFCPSHQRQTPLWFNQSPLTKDIKTTVKLWLFFTTCCAVTCQRSTNAK